jgi:hypothetical protein
MPRKNLTKPLFFTCLFALAIFAGRCVAFADTKGTTGTANIERAWPTVLSLPASFVFPAQFIPKTFTEKTYKLLSPTVATEILKITDADELSGFHMDMRVTDLTPAPDSDNVIRLTKMGFVTLSASSPSPIDSAPINIPPGTAHIIAPAWCNWDLISGNLASECEASMINFTPDYFVPGHEGTTTLAADINPGDTIINVNDGTQLPTPGVGYTLKIKIGSDLISYSGNAGNQLSGVTDIDSPHTAGATVKEYPTVSEPVTIMEDSTFTDRGIYSNGFGFRLNVDPSVIAADYSADILFSFNTIP